LAFADAMDHRIVCKPLKLNGRKLLGHPRIESVVE
jgi:hypothetical protein